MTIHDARYSKKIKNSENIHSSEMCQSRTVTSEGILNIVIRLVSLVCRHVMTVTADRALNAKRLFVNMLLTFVFWSDFRCEDRNVVYDVGEVTATGKYTPA